MKRHLGLGLLCATALVSALAIGPSEPSAKPAANGAAPSALSQVPTFEFHDCVFAVNLTDENDNPWLEPVVVQITFPATGFSTRVHATPNSNGRVVATAKVDASCLAPARPGHVEVWAARPEDAPTQTRDTFFLNPTDGVAAFVSGVTPVWRASAGAYAMSIPDMALTEPGYFGTILFQGVAGAGLQLVTDGGSDENEADTSLAYGIIALSQQVPTNAVSLDLWTWSVSSAVGVHLFGPAGCEVGSARLLRNGTSTIAIQSERTLSVSIDESSMGDARYVLVVREEHHSPNSSESSGSDIPFFAQRSRSYRFDRVSFANGGFAAYDTISSEGFVVEVWSAAPAQDPLQGGVLLGYESIQPGSVDVSVSF